MIEMKTVAATFLKVIISPYETILLRECVMNTCMVAI